MHAVATRRATTTGKYQAEIKPPGEKQTNLGTHATAEAAARAYDAAAVRGDHTPPRAALGQSGERRTVVTTREDRSLARGSVGGGAIDRANRGVVVAQAATAVTDA